MQQTNLNSLPSPPPKIQSRGLVQIIYSSTSGNSKAAADDLQVILQTNNYLPPITNIGDYDPEELLGHKGTIIFLLSTYGDGDSPADGQDFLEWIQKLQVKGQEFQHLQYAILAFGNSSFDNHCGFGLRTQTVLKKGAAQQLLQLTKCDASNQDRNCKAKFPLWSKQLIQKLNSIHSLEWIERSALGNAYKVTLENRLNYDWQVDIGGKHNIAKQFMNYWQMDKCRVIHIRELRKDSKQSKRSTLWLRVQTAKHPHLQHQITPATNIDLFPINMLESHPQDQHIVNFNEVKGKMPFPPMPLRQIRKLLDYRKIASDKQIKAAINMSQAQQSVIERYEQRLKGKEEMKVTIKELMDELKPSFQFMAYIGMNRVRTYTLSSWDPKKQYVDLVISLVDNGLASSYLSSYPEYVRLRPVVSSLYMPTEPRPICMIANGSGIAPFRSITQYMASLPAAKRCPLRFYYGIQREDADYYFAEEWKEYEEKKLIEMRVAQSRKDKNKKEYVQDVLEKDIDWLHDHIFKHNGVVFICGGASMSKDVNNVIFKAVSKEVSMPYKAFALVAQLKTKKVIVEEVYG